MTNIVFEMGTRPSSGEYTKAVCIDKKRINCFKFLNSFVISYFGIVLKIIWFSPF